MSRPRYPLRGLRRKGGEAETLEGYRKVAVVGARVRCLVLIPSAAPIKALAPNWFSVGD